MAVVANISLSSNPAADWASFETYIQTSTRIKTKRPKNSQQQRNPVVAPGISIPDSWTRTPGPILEAPDTVAALVEKHGSLEGRRIDWGRYPHESTMHQLAARPADTHIQHQLAAGPATYSRHTHQLAAGPATYSRHTHQLAGVTQPLPIAALAKKFKAGDSSSAPQFDGIFSSLRSGLANWSTPSDAMAAELVSSRSNVVALQSELASMRISLASHASEMTKMTASLASAERITAGIQSLLTYTQASYATELAGEKVVNANLQETVARLEERLEQQMRNVPLNLGLFSSMDLDGLPHPPGFPLRPPSPSLFM
jgi:hypothetical protein